MSRINRWSRRTDGADSVTRQILNLSSLEGYKSKFTTRPPWNTTMN